MQPSKIKNVLDLAHKVRMNGGIFNPLFVGPPGIGKSEIVQAWCKERGMEFIDLRAAYLEAPDAIGFPTVETVNGRQVTKHNTPDFWPQGGDGVVLLDEVNRGTSSVMNVFMQLLTDRKVHHYELPKGWMVVGAINPETGDYDAVNAMDTALKNRFEIFNVEYDKNSFVGYMKDTRWDPRIVSFVESGMWSYQSPENIGTDNGNKYVSPRNLKKLDYTLKADIQKDFQPTVFESILGLALGKTFYHFLHNESPVLYRQLLDDKENSLEKLKLFSDPKNYKNAHISITVKDIVDDGTITDKLLAEVCLAIPADQSPILLKQLELKRKMTPYSLFENVQRIEPKLKKYYKEILAR